MQNLGSAILFQALEKQHGYRFTIKEALTLCESNPVYRQGCQQNREIMARAIENTCSGFDAVREDIGDESYYEHAEHTNSGRSYIYQALRLVRDGEMAREGKYPLFIVEPLFGAADLELQLQIEDNYDTDYRTKDFHYQQVVYVRGTPIREESEGFLFKKYEIHQKFSDDEMISGWTDGATYIHASLDFDQLANAIAKDILKTLIGNTQSKVSNVVSDVDVSGAGRNGGVAVWLKVESRILSVSATATEQLSILEVLIKELLALGSPTDELMYSIYLEWIDVDGTRIELKYEFYVGKYLASNGDEPDRANLNRKMIECLNEGEDCPTTYEYWGPLIYEFLGSTNLAEDDFWWETELLIRANFSINLYMWAEKLIAQRKAFGNNSNWTKYIKGLLTGKVGRYYVVPPQNNQYMGHEITLRAQPDINNHNWRGQINFDVYGAQPVPGKNGLLLNYSLGIDHAEDSLYRTGFLHDEDTLLFFGPDEASTMLMVLKYCCLMHHRTMSSSWLDQENHPYNPWEDDNLEITENYEWDEPNSGKTMPTIEELLAAEQLRLGENRWPTSIYIGDRLVFWGSNIFKVYRVKF